MSVSRGGSGAGSRVTRPRVERSMAHAIFGSDKLTQFVVDRGGTLSISIQSYLQG